jgi:hypothetical protein
MTIHIAGRSIYKTAPAAEIWFGSDRWSSEEPAFTLEAADLQEFEHNSTFRLTTKHEDGTDVEHDSAYVFELVGTGLTFVDFSGPQIKFRAVALEVRHYPANFKIEDGADISRIDMSDDVGDKIYTCQDTEYYHPDETWPPGHLMMPYMPPHQEIKVGPIFIVFKWGTHRG